MNTAVTLPIDGGHDSGGIVPCAPDVLRLAAAGAMIGGAWAAFADVPRVRAQGASLEEALRHTLRNAAIGAGAGVLVGAVACVARTHPVIGVAAVLTAGAGALYLAERSRKQQLAETTAVAEPEPEPQAEPTEPVPARRPRRRATR